MKLPDVGTVAISVIPGRMQTVKIHMALFEAKKAVLSQKYNDWRREAFNLDRVPEAQIYTIVDNQWFLLYDIKAGTMVSELPWKKDK